MRFRLAFISILLSLVAFSASTSALGQDEVGRQVAPAVATIFARDSTGRFEVVGSGVFVRPDGVLLTAYNLVQGSREIQVRMADGETYDHVEVAATDERRNVAVLRVPATRTPYVGIAATDEASVGTEVRAVYNASGQVVSESAGVLSSISLADEIPGAGTGFRVLKFTAQIAPAATGGILLDIQGRVLGLLAPRAQSRSQSYAVPLYNVVGLLRAIPASQAAGASVVLVPGVRELNRAVPVYQSSTTPLAQMPTVAVPQRPTTALRPAGPGSTVVRETDPAKLLVNSRTLYVVSASNIFKSIQLVNELRKRHELTDWNLSLVDEPEVADLILELGHVPLTWEFNYSVRHQRTGVIVSAGKVYAWGGGDGAQLMASRIVEKLTKLRASVKIESKADAGAKQ